VTPAEFKALFPEFSRAEDPLVQTRITWAEQRTDEEVWGEKYDQGVALLTAHYLALLPEAKDLRKGEKPGETMYERERMKVARVVASGFRLAGLP